jgi:hypothetical protein
MGFARFADEAGLRGIGGVAGYGAAGRRLAPFPRAGAALVLRTGLNTGKLLRILPVEPPIYALVTQISLYASIFLPL